MASTARWARLAAELHRELREVADLAAIDPRWWLLAGGAALPWSRVGAYVISDAEPASDTFIGRPTPAPANVVGDAIARAHAARAAIEALDGQLPDQPLSVTVRRCAYGAITEPSTLEHAAFAIGDRTWVAALLDAPGAEHALAQELAAVIVNPDAPTTRLRPLGEAVPFVCITLGDEPLATARHGHRRAWQTTNDFSVGPWLGLSRADGMEIVSTSHMIVDGFGHSQLSSLIHDRQSVRASVDVSVRDAPRIPPDAIALRIASKELVEVPRALDLAHKLGVSLHRLAGRPDARFSPTFQIPIAPGDRSDPDRFKRRVVPAIVSVRFDHGTPEPFAAFAARTRELLSREASGTGVSAHLLAAARGVPASLAWKRRAVGPARPRWLESMANLIGGRGCVSKITGEPAVAVSSPSRLATDADPLGSCVVTIVATDQRAIMTVASSGIDPDALVHEIV
ncbi:MAG: hypothetical protein ABI678_26205 [Kofleriaceae bacterium]